MLADLASLKRLFPWKFIMIALLGVCVVSVGRTQTMASETSAPLVTPPAQNAAATDMRVANAKAALDFAGTLRFAQISDAHLFDAGYKCSGLYVEREYQENLNALRWSIDEINRRWKSGDRIDFLVFTGDMGITNLSGLKQERPGLKKDAPCFSLSDPESARGPIEQMDFANAEALIANLIDCLPGKLPIYFLPGNNDVRDEDATDTDRYERFVNGLGKLTHGHAVVDLNGRAVKEGGYKLIGLNSAGFKPYKPSGFTDQGKAASDPGNSPKPIDEEASVTKGKIQNASGSPYCNELTSGVSSRADDKEKAIKSFQRLVSGSEPYVIFTHEPDLQDPYRTQAENSSGETCEYRSAWLLTEDARNVWMKSGLDNAYVVGVFAGHFHTPDLSKYGGPLTNPAVEAVYGSSSILRPGGLAPQFVTPPLAIKLQWPYYPAGARGMMFVSVVKGVVNAQVDPYWSTLSPSCCGDDKTSLQKSLLKALRDHPDYSFLIALLFTLVLVIAVLVLAGELDPTCKYTSKATYRIARFAGNRIVCLKHTALKVLIDGQTNTYSLSKMQFMLWTLASIYGYAYLCVAHSWVQGLPGLPDIADQFPFEQSLSGVTAIATEYLQRKRGTKGGGPLKPQLSDLISAGGVIAPGRLQFFSWTLAAIAAYVGSVLASDPCTAHALPTIPRNLLIISGLSSFAYLGARAAAAPGPVIGSAHYVPGPPPAGSGAGGPAAGGAGGAPLDPPPPTPAVAGRLSLIGSGFSKLATVVLVEAKKPVVTALTNLPVAIETVSDNTPSPSDDEPTLDMSKSDVQVGAPPYVIDPKFVVPGFPDYGTKLEVGIVNDLDMTKTYRIRVTNPDGKYGEGMIEADPTK